MVFGSSVSFLVAQVSSPSRFLMFSELLHVPLCLVFFMFQHLVQSARSLFGHLCGRLVSWTFNKTTGLHWHPGSSSLLTLLSYSVELPLKAEGRD